MRYKTGLDCKGCGYLFPEIVKEMFHSVTERTIYHTEKANANATDRSSFHMYSGW